MHTSFEQRLEFLQQFSDGLELFSLKHPHAKIDYGIFIFIFFIILVLWGSGGY